MSDRSVSRRVRGLLLAILAAVGNASAAESTALPDIVLTRWVDGFHQPVHLQPVPGSDRLMVVEQQGLIREVSRTGGEHRVFLDLRDRVDAGGEKGLLSVAFHPRFATNRRFFVNYTTKLDGQLHTRVSAFTAQPDLQRADRASEQTILLFRQPYGNHNGGLVQFGPDGFLYVGNGDGGSGNDPQNHGQRLDTWLGKLLRIDVDRTEGGRPYGVPRDNPFVGQPEARPEIYAYGLRNPWRFSFDRATRTLWCGDVGQNTREEVDVIVKGGNYGWRITEGFICTPAVNPDCNTNGLLAPVVDYPRAEGVSVTGGYVYRGKRWPALQGVYLYGDFASGRYWGLRWADGVRTAHRELIRHGPPPASFAEDHDGELYVVGYDGTIYTVGLRPAH